MKFVLSWKLGVAILFATGLVGAEETGVWEPGHGHPGGRLEVRYHNYADTFTLSRVPADIQGKVVDAICVGENAAKGDQGPWATGLALLVDGTVRVWGDQVNGLNEVPGDLKDVVQVGAGLRFAAALTKSGEVVTWGKAPKTPAGRFERIAVADWTLYCLTREGRLVGEGANEGGQMEWPGGMGHVVQVITRGVIGFALNEDGKLFHWGRPKQPLPATDFPADLPPLRSFAISSIPGYGITKEGRLVVWGDPEHSAVKASKKLEGAEATAVQAGYYKVAMRTPSGQWQTVSGLPDEAGEMFEGASNVFIRDPHIMVVYAAPTTAAPKPAPTVAEMKSKPPEPKPEPAAADNGKVTPPDYLAVNTLVGAFRKALDEEAGAPHRAAMSELDGKYLTALTREEEGAFAKGDLDLVTAVKAEIEKVKKAELQGGDATAVPEGLRPFREAYRKQASALRAERDAKAARLVAELDGQLMGLEINLTKEKNLKAALEIRGFRNALGDWLKGEFGLSLPTE